MARKMKSYVAIVRDNSEQARRVMDVPGYSHFSQPFDYYPNGTCRYAFIRGTNKVAIQKLVKSKLGEVYQDNLNFVEQYDPNWHKKTWKV